MSDVVEIRPIARAAITMMICIAFSLSLMTLMSCGTADEQQSDAQQSAGYDAWNRYTYGSFTAYFSPMSPFSADKERFVKAYNNFLSEICSFLELPAPENKITLYVYATPQDMETVAGRSVAFMTDSAIHWDGRTPYGYQLTKFVLAKNGIQPGKFRVAYEGIANLLDFSGVNYHKEAANLAGTDWFVSLEKLGENGVFDSMPDPLRRTESASLAGFIMYNYGPERLLALARSQEGWKETLETLFQVELDVFEQSWLEFAEAHGENPETEGDEATP